jgi:hypothetical protein
VFSVNMRAGSLTKVSDTGAQADDLNCDGMCVSADGRLLYREPGAEIPIRRDPRLTALRHRAPPARFEKSGPLVDPDPSTFYSPGPKGYTDFV